MATRSEIVTPIVTYHHADWVLAELQAMKADRRVSVCIPARNEEATIGSIVATVRRELLEGSGLVDDLLVVDDQSADATGIVAFAAGARVVSSPAPAGKGEAMRLAVAASTGDIIVFLDGDVENFGAHFVTGLLGPVLCRHETMLVKACYRRPLGDALTGGGRVTELVARPVLSLLFPELLGVTQPLAGEVAVRREALDHIDLADGYVATVWARSPRSTSRSVPIGTDLCTSSLHRPATFSTPPSVARGHESRDRVRPGCGLQSRALHACEGSRRRRRVSASCGRNGTKPQWRARRGVESLRQ